MKLQLVRYSAITFLLSLVFLVVLNGRFVAHAAPVTSATLPPPTITVTPITPNFDVQDPTNLQEAASFAWQEFIALTWPAPAQGPTTFPRGVPLTSATYGNPGPTGQVVFETFRHKSEVFPGAAATPPNGYDPNKQDFGFSSIPKYQYSTTIPPFPGLKNPSIPPFNNLDEVTQITLNAMYAGIVDPQPTMGASSATNPMEKILFQAKMNETGYVYVASNNFWGQDTNPNLASILMNSGSFVQTGDAKTYPGPYINLPASDPTNKKLGTIEIKTAWRRLNKNEDPSKFYTARVRYYKGTIVGGSPVLKGFVDSDQVGETWALVALHIIQKTPNAPAFIYATFGHINNIVDTNGNPIEEPDGTTKPQYVNNAPFIPPLTITPPPPINGKSQTETTTGTPAVNTNSPQLYYHNVSGREVTTINGSKYKNPITVNRRLYMIPPTITAVNRAAHQAISGVNNQAVWLNYRLVNVQAYPIDIESLPTLPDTLKATYYLANEVVETNPSLQQFSGGLNPGNGTIFDCSNYISPQPPGKDYNTFVVADPNKPAINKYLMGGCMGCHGSQGQKAGGDFSVILANGRVPDPDIVELDETQGTFLQRKFLKYYGRPLKLSRARAKAEDSFCSQSQIKTSVEHTAG